jgi:hypothetical protein
MEISMEIEGMAWHLICSLNNNNGEIIVWNPIVVVYFHPMRKICTISPQKKTLVETSIGQLFDFLKEKTMGWRYLEKT